uniref:ARID domain-containing protein n=1 Tax=Tetranychus urticae TaxID=32264 RepID=T1KE97_TETUR
MIWTLKSTNFTIVCSSVLDLFELYKLVVHHGGLVEVINKKIWREITKGLNLPSSITSAAFTLRSQYMKYLYPFECDRENLSTPEELQQAIDGNRREGRRSSNGQYSDMMESSIEAGGSGSVLRDGILCSGGSPNGGPSNGRPANGGLSSLGMTSTQPLSLDSVSNNPLSRNPSLALAAAQTVTLNLESKRYCFWCSSWTNTSRGYSRNLHWTTQIYSNFNNSQRPLKS